MWTNQLIIHVWQLSEQRKNKQCKKSWPIHIVKQLIVLAQHTSTIQHVSFFCIFLSFSIFFVRDWLGNLVYGMCGVVLSVQCDGIESSMNLTKYTSKPQEAHLLLKAKEQYMLHVYIVRDYTGKNKHTNRMNENKQNRWRKNKKIGVLVRIICSFSFFFSLHFVSFCFVFVKICRFLIVWLAFKTRR